MDNNYNFPPSNDLAHMIERKKLEVARNIQTLSDTDQQHSTLRMLNDIKRLIKDHQTIY